jgi:hypothetical protein
MLYCCFAALLLLYYLLQRCCSAVAARLSRAGSTYSKVGSKVLSHGLDLRVLVAALLQRLLQPEVRTHECLFRHIDGHMRLKRQYAADWPHALKEAVSGHMQYAASTYCPTETAAVVCRSLCRFVL